MIYFSRVEIDPDKIDLDQIERLKKFKERSYPKGLMESYKKIIEFRDKFAKQLELKIRDLQLSDKSGGLPLSIEFISMENGKPIGGNLDHYYEHPNVRSFDSVPREKVEKLKELVAIAIKEKSYLPIVLAIENSSPSGIRNLYVELDVTGSSDKLEVTASPAGSFDPTFIFHTTNVAWLGGRSEIAQRVGAQMAKFDPETLQREGKGWRISFEWEALQPKRIRFIRPALYVYSPESANLTIRAKIFADSFPDPFVLKANVSVKVVQVQIDLTDLLPNLDQLIADGTGNTGIVGVDF
jgi:hypothetical protein